jgi:stringent starvation protein B
MSLASTKPYLLRAIYDWCLDQGFTPYLAVVVDERTVVPQQYVKDGQIVLNIGPEAAHQLHLGNDLIALSARFGGVAQNLSIPVAQVAAVYARENGHGMAFEVGAAQGGEAEAQPASIGEASGAEAASAEGPTEPDKPGGGRPHLVRVK